MTTDLSDIAFVKRIAIGGAGGMVTTQDVEAQNRRADVMEREKEERILKDAA